MHHEMLHADMPPEIRNGKLKREDEVTISENAWRGGGGGTDGSTSYQAGSGSRIPLGPSTTVPAVDGQDLTKLLLWCQTTSRACHVPIPYNYPLVGTDAFRTATGLPLMRGMPLVYPDYADAHLDWVQYKTSFRDPVMVRRAVDRDERLLPLAEIAIDLRHAESARLPEQLRRRIAAGRRLRAEGGDHEHDRQRHRMPVEFARAMHGDVSVTSEVGRGTTATLVAAVGDPEARRLPAAMKRAGADLILTYHAVDAAKWLK